jgi:hypothetical protein
VGGRCVRRGVRAGRHAAGCCPDDGTRPVVFALANPVPEVPPELVTGLPAMVTTGRSDYANQVNKVLVLPGARVPRAAAPPGYPFDTSTWPAIQTAKEVPKS